MDAIGKPQGDRLAILVEEVGEVAHELTYDQGIQVSFTQPVDPMVTKATVEYDEDGGAWVFIEGLGDYRSTTALSEMSDENLALVGIKRTTAWSRLRAELVQVGAMAAHLDRRPGCGGCRVSDRNDRKVTKKFRKWWKAHRKHPILKEHYSGVAWCARCGIVAPKPFKEN